MLDELALLLPSDIPNRESLIQGAAKHLDMIAEVNSRMNLTRITEPREAVIKHVVDSVMPWSLFSHAKRVLDAGTGPGFPGIPLALVLPNTRFVLAESTQKKARFVQAVVDALELKNVEVVPERAEEAVRSRPVDLIAARALAPLNRALSYFGPALKSGARALFYKGPDVETEITAAFAEVRKHRVQLSIIMRYELPDDLGSRTIVQIENSRL